MWRIASPNNFAPPVSRTREYWGDIVPLNYYGDAALGSGELLALTQTP